MLVNVACGNIVHEQRLAGALEAGVIAEAGLVEEAFENEPDVPSALCRPENAVLQPHQGSATIETRTAMVRPIVDNHCLCFEKAGVLTPV